MTKNMTVCPHCESEFQTVDTVSDPPMQCLSQQCTECDYTEQVGIVNYPNREYTVTSEALPSDRCTTEVPEAGDGFGYTTCDRDAVVRLQRVGRAVHAECEDHLTGMYRHAIDLEPGDDD